MVPWVGLWSLFVVDKSKEKSTMDYINKEIAKTNTMHQTSLRNPFIFKAKIDIDSDCKSRFSCVIALLSLSLRSAPLEHSIIPI